MRLTTVILIASLLQVSAASFGQRITLNKSNASIFSVLKDIRKQSGYDFYYDQKTIPQALKVSVSLSNATIEDALSSTLNGLNLVYEIDGKTVSIKRREEPSFLERIIDRFNRIDIRGRIVSSDGSPISGATVTVKGTKQSAVTDRNGLFSFDAVDEDALLIITYVGYKTKEIAAKANLNGVILELSDNPLDEVQVIAYGTTSRRLSTGNVGGIKASDIEKQPVSNPLLALQGRVSGVTITQNSGLSGGGIAVNIQGLNSIAKGNDPFYVIDGVPFTSQLLPNWGDILGSSGSQGSTFGIQKGNPLNLINPADIESIDILKDADATAIYGSRAANGAILITTKKGRTGKTGIDVNLQQGFGEVPKFLDVMNTTQYLAMRKEAFRNDGLQLPDPSMLLSQKNDLNYDLSVWDTTRNTNWQRELIGGTASYTDINAGISGGNGQTSFRLNGGYHRETTIFPGDFSDVKGSFSGNLNHTSLNNKFSIIASIKFVADDNRLPNSDLTRTSLSLAPLSPALYKEDGNLNWERIEINAATRDSVSTWTNPIAALNASYQNKSNNLNVNSTISYEILNGLRIKTDLGYNLLNQRDYSLTPLTIYAPELRPNNSRGANFSSGALDSWIAEPQLTYNKSVFGGKMEILIGSTFQQNNSVNAVYRGSGYISDQLLKDVKSASSILVVSSLDSKYKYSALFSRINYNFKDRYIINLTGRRDGSSRFGPENQFHDFWAIGAAWLFSNESYIKQIIPALSYGKLRASYGVTGNDQIGDYEFLSLYSTTSTANPYQLSTGLAPTKHANPNLQWEITKKFQTGLDLGFLNDRILFNANYYNNRSSNQLINYFLPVSSGFNTVAKNFPAVVENAGWELALNTNNVTSGVFRWSSSFNLTLPRNKLLAFPGLSTSSYNTTLTIGQPIGATKVNVYAGVNQQSGTYQFLSANGSIVNVPVVNSDRTFIFSGLPKYYGGLQNSLSYRDFGVDFLFQFVNKKGLDSYSGNQSGLFAGSSSIGNQPLWVLDRWQNSNTKASTIQKYNTNGNLGGSDFDAASSNLVVSDASFIRLKNVSVSWNLPGRWIKPLSFQKVRLFVQGQNLATFTGYKGLDPETASSAPILRVMTTGIQVGL